jgi:hypothetical protein
MRYATCLRKGHEQSGDSQGGAGKFIERIICWLHKVIFRRDSRQNEFQGFPENGRSHRALSNVS